MRAMPRGSVNHLTRDVGSEYITLSSNVEESRTNSYVYYPHARSWSKGKNINREVGVYAGGNMESKIYTRHRRINPRWKFRASGEKRRKSLLENRKNNDK